MWPLSGPSRGICIELESVLPCDSSNDEQRAHAGEPRAPTPLSMLDEADLDWIADVLDRFERAAGQPWRVALEAIDALPVSRRRLAAVRVALARLTGTRGALAPLGKRVRALVLGAPAFAPAERRDRFELAAASLGIAAEEVEPLLFVDLRGERPVVLPRGRPSELEVAAFANVHLIQRALARAHRVSITVREDDGTLLRAARARGLLVTATLEGSHAMTLDLVGPLALFHRTAVYGRTIGQLVPLLAAAADWRLELETTEASRSAGQPRGWANTLAPPVLLPRAPIDRAGTHRPYKLARALERLDPDLRMIVGPPPLVAGTQLACPDLAIEVAGEPWYLELVGFWTADYLARKLAAYRAAGVSRVILSVDESRGCAGDALDPARIPAGAIVHYTKRVTAAAIHALVVPRGAAC
jgi:predicted nuclease of restriction endonuclease-like RecB superfamily